MASATFDRESIISAATAVLHDGNKVASDYLIRCLRHGLSTAFREHHVLDTIEFICSSGTPEAAQAQVLATSMASFTQKHTVRFLRGISATPGASEAFLDSAESCMVARIGRMVPALYAGGQGARGIAATVCRALCRCAVTIFALRSQPLTFLTRIESWVTSGALGLPSSSVSRSVNAIAYWWADLSESIWSLLMDAAALGPICRSSHRLVVQRNSHELLIRSWVPQCAADGFVATMLDFMTMYATGSMQDVCPQLLPTLMEHPLVTDCLLSFTALAKVISCIVSLEDDSAVAFVKAALDRGVASATAEEWCLMVGAIMEGPLEDIMLLDSDDITAIRLQIEALLAQTSSGLQSLLSSSAQGSTLREPQWALQCVRNIILLCGSLMLHDIPQMEADDDPEDFAETTSEMVSANEKRTECAQRLSAFLFWCWSFCCEYMKCCGSTSSQEVAEAWLDCDRDDWDYGVDVSDSFAPMIAACAGRLWRVFKAMGATSSALELLNTMAPETPPTVLGVVGDAAALEMALQRGCSDGIVTATTALLCHGGSVSPSAPIEVAVRMLQNTGILCLKIPLLIRIANHAATAIDDPPAFLSALGDLVALTAGVLSRSLNPHDAHLQSFMVAAVSLYSRRELSLTGTWRVFVPLWECGPSDARCLALLASLQKAVELCDAVDIDGALSRFVFLWAEMEREASVNHGSCSHCRSMCASLIPKVFPWLLSAASPQALNSLYHTLRSVLSAHPLSVTDCSILGPTVAAFCSATNVIGTDACTSVVNEMMRAVEVMTCAEHPQMLDIGEMIEDGAVFSHSTEGTWWCLQLIQWVASHHASRTMYVDTALRVLTLVASSLSSLLRASQKQAHTSIPGSRRRDLLLVVDAIVALAVSIIPHDIDEDSSTPNAADTALDKLSEAIVDAGQWCSSLLTTDVKIHPNTIGALTHASGKIEARRFIDRILDGES